jgi:predicted membrane chloride channel (bestrophin family)
MTSVSVLAVAAAAISLSPRPAPQSAPPAAGAIAAARAPPPRCVWSGDGTSGFPKTTDDGYTFSNANARSLLGEKTGSEAWLEVLLSTGRSRILQRISGHLGWTVAAATAFTGLLGAARGGYLPADVTAAVEGLTLPPLAHESVGTVIALLLAFRVQQAYERFWDGRELWASVYSDTRGLVRLASCVAAEAEGGGEGLGEADAVVALAAAWPYALKQHLRGELNEKELTDAADALLLTQDERLLMAVDIDTSALDGGDKKKGSKGAAQRKARRLKVRQQLRRATRTSNVALGTLRALTAAVLPLRSHGDLLWWQLDSHVAGMTSTLGKAEKIKSTPAPLSYSRHVSRFFSVRLARNSGRAIPDQFSAQFLCVTDGVPIPSRLSTAQVYAFTLPLALASFSDQNLLLLPPVVAVVAWVLFATEEIGHIIEDPFGRGLAPDPDNPAASDIPGSSQLEVLPLGRYCAEIAADVSMLAFSIEDRSIEEMPGACLPRRLSATSFHRLHHSHRLLHPTGGDDDVLLFDDLA